MKTKHLILLMLLFMFMSAVAFTSCSDDEANDNSLPINYDKYSEIYEDLMNTSWVLTDAKDEMGNRYKSFNDYEGESVTFSSENNGSLLKLYSSLFPEGDSGSWYIEEDGTLFFSSIGDNPNFSDIGGFSVVMGNGGEIVTLNNNMLVFRRYSEIYGSYSEHSYRSIPYIDYGGSSVDDPNTGPSTKEKPEIIFEDYTINTTSIIVYYRVTNQDKAKVKTVKGYYGTTSATKQIGGSIVGSRIEIKITGLNKGTTYYIKCSAIGSGGTTTTDTIRLTTLF